MEYVRCFPSEMAIFLLHHFKELSIKAPILRGASGSNTKFTLKHVDIITLCGVF